ncbi:MAG: YggS family pyridoxal phosphate-dependent enzyme [Chitinophagaceae bacterium]
MPVNIEKFTEIRESLGKAVKLVVVSKLRTAEEIKVLYDLGQRDFAENYVQELLAKQLELPKDIRWHFIGHLQSNKAKYIAPFIHSIQGVDSFNLLEEIDRQAAKNDRIVNCFLQIHIAREDTKFGLDAIELKELVAALPKYKLVNKLNNVKICGLMGMASFSDDSELVKNEFRYLKCLFDDTRSDVDLPSFKQLSMGMSNDYKLAVDEGSTMVRIGSLIFGKRPDR